MIDIVYVVGPDAGGDELRYSLRSAAAHVPHRRVWIAGVAPDWVTDDVGRIPVPQTASRFENSTANLLAACDHPEVSERFQLWNDDFFALLPVEGAPAWHRGPLTPARRNRRRPPAQSANYRDGRSATYDLLVRWGHTEPRSYELHVPMELEAGEAAEIIRRAQADTKILALHKRSLIGNVTGARGELAKDVKIASQRYTPPAGWAWVSTNARSFTDGQVGKVIRRRFPEPCRYEKGT